MELTIEAEKRAVLDIIMVRVGGCECLEIVDYVRESLKPKSITLSSALNRITKTVNTAVRTSRSGATKNQPRPAPENAVISSV